MRNSKIEKIYFRHEKMVDYYASKVFNERNVSLTKDDIKQELKMRLWSAIQTYLKKYEDYMKNDGVKPIPLPFYLKTVMINRIKDFIKEINTVQNVSVEEVSYDFGRSDFSSNICLEDKSISVGHTNILEDFTDSDRKMLFLSIRGVDIKKISKIYKGINVEKKLDNLYSDVKERILENIEEENYYETFNVGDDF